MIRVLLVFALASAMRPDPHRPDRAATISGLFDSLAEPGRDAAESLSALKAAEDVAADLVSQSVSEPLIMSDDDRALLMGIIDTVQGSIYNTMNSSHHEEERELAMSLAAVSACNSAIAARLGADGDIGGMRQSAHDSYNEMNTVASDLQEKTDTRDTERSALDVHKTQAPPAPSCSDLPTSKTDAAWDAYFETNAHAAWFQEQQSAYLAKREAVLQAESELSATHEEFERTQERLEAEYCAWKSTLTSGCEAFNVCYEGAAADFEELKQRLQVNMDLRTEAYKAGEMVVAHIKVMLNPAVAIETPDVDESRFHITLPDTPGPESCELAELAESRWDSLSCSAESPQRCNRFEAEDGVATASIPQPITFGELKRNFSLTVIVQVTEQVKHWSGIFGGDCHTMGLWWEDEGYIVNERQCGPHPGDSKIHVQAEVGSKYKIQIRRAGRTGTMTLSHLDASDRWTEIGTSSYFIDYDYTNGIQVLGMAYKGRQFFSGKVFCLDFHSD